MTISYCPSNDSVFNNIWTEHGVSRCFMETFAPLPILILVSILGFIQLRRYLKCKALKKSKAYKRLGSIQLGDGVEFDMMSSGCQKCKFEGFAFSSIPKPFFYVCQWVLHLIQLLLPIVDLIGRISICLTCFHGSVILQNLAYMVAWSIALRSLERERKVSYRACIKTHSWLFIAFWGLALAIECIAFVSWNSHQWWFVARDSQVKQLELWVFCIRFSASLLIFLLGFKAPGLYKEKKILIEGTEDQETGRGRKKVHTTYFVYCVVQIESHRSIGSLAFCSKTYLKC